MSKTFFVEELNSHSGNRYLGLKLKRDEVLYYLEELKNAVGLHDYSILTNNQKVRDNEEYHLTLISPDEFRVISVFERRKITGKECDLTLLGLGMVSRKDTSVYYVVSKSNFGTKVRRMLKLPEKDFHITLGFNDSDIHDVTKDSTTILNKRR